MSRHLVVTAISFTAFSAVALTTVAQAQSLPSGAFEVAQAPADDPAASGDDKERGEGRKKRDGEGGRGQDGGGDQGAPPKEPKPQAEQAQPPKDKDSDGGERRGRRERDGDGAPPAQQAQPPPPPVPPPVKQAEPPAPPAPPPVQQAQPPLPPPSPPAAQRDDSGRGEGRGRGERDRGEPPPVKQAQPPISPPPAAAAPPAPPTPPAAQRDDNERGERRGRGERDRDGPPPVKQAQPPASPAPPPPAAAAPPPPSGPGTKGDRRQVGGGAGSIDEIKRGRRQRVEDGGRRTIIEEPGNRTIVQDKGGRAMIRHDEGERLRRTSRDVRTERRSDGGNLTIAIRPGGIEVYSEFDSAGRLQRRYRRGRDGRETNLIDNRRFRGGGPVILDLRPPVLRMPRDRYIVEYERASDRDIYDALEAGPIERLDRGYSLEEIRYNAYLRDRMRRIDLDTVNFEFGAWQVPPDQYRRLERIANAINRVLDRRPDEVFLIEGHTDAVGSEIDNLTLSDRRAEEVAIILTDTFGVPPENLVTQGYGEEFLKVPTAGPERLNRRVAARRITPLLAGRAGR